MENVRHCGLQPKCQGQSWAAVTSLIENKHCDSICTNLPTDLPILATAHEAAYFIGSLPHIIFAVSSHRSRVQMTFVSHQMLCGRCHSIYCHSDLLVQNDHSHREEHIRKARQAVMGSFWMPTPPTTFIATLSGPHILLLVIVWPSAVLRAYTAKQTRSLCQTQTPSFYPSNPTPLRLFC